MSRRSSVSSTPVTSAMWVSRSIAGFARCALAEAGIGRRPQLVAGGPQQGAHFLPGPAGRPGTMGDNEHGHDRAPSGWPGTGRERAARGALTSFARTLSRPADMFKPLILICAYRLYP